MVEKTGSDSSVTSCRCYLGSFDRAIANVDGSEGGSRGRRERTTDRDIVEVREWRGQAKSITRRDIQEELPEIPCRVPLGI